MSSRSTTSPRIRALDESAASPAAARILARVGRALGMVPNLHRTLAHAPAALKAYADTVGTLGEGVLDARLREQIAVATAGLNGCGYCASAHTALGRGLDLPESELCSNLSCTSSDRRTAAALAFVRSLVDHRGGVPDADLTAVRQAGFGDEEILEIVAHVAMNTFTNLVNNLARTEIDFPVVELAQVA